MSFQFQYLLPGLMSRYPLSSLMCLLPSLMCPLSSLMCQLPEPAAQLDGLEPAAQLDGPGPAAQLDDPEPAAQLDDPEPPAQLDDPEPAVCPDVPAVCPDAPDAQPEVPVAQPDVPPSVAIDNGQLQPVGASGGHSFEGGYCQEMFHPLVISVIWHAVLRSTSRCLLAVWNCQESFSLLMLSSLGRSTGVHQRMDPGSVEQTVPPTI
ncbi:hypothetical protein AB205_0087790, partial [Aquarana catesbeiana]